MLAHRTVSYTWNPIHLVWVDTFWYSPDLANFGFFLSYLLLSRLACWTGNPWWGKALNRQQRLFYLYSRRHIPMTFFFYPLIPCRRIMSTLFGIFFSLDVLNSCSTLSLYFPCLCIYIVYIGPERCCTRSVKNGRVFHSVLSSFSHRSFQMGAQTVTIIV